MPEGPSTLETIEFRIGQTEMHLGQLDEKVDRLTDKIDRLFGKLAQTQCPRPGLCVVLEEKIKTDERDKAELKARVTALEHNVAYAEGFGKGMSWVVTIASGSIGALAVFILTRIFK